MNDLKRWVFEQPKKNQFTLRFYDKDARGDLKKVPLIAEMWKAVFDTKTLNPRGRLNHVSSWQGWHFFPSKKVYRIPFVFTTAGSGIQLVLTFVCQDYNKAEVLSWLAEINRKGGAAKEVKTAPQLIPESLTFKSSDVGGGRFGFSKEILRHWGITKKAGFLQGTSKLFSGTNGLISVFEAQRKKGLVWIVTDKCTNLKQISVRDNITHIDYVSASGGRRLYRINNLSMPSKEERISGIKIGFRQERVGKSYVLGKGGMWRREKARPQETAPKPAPRPVPKPAPRPAPKPVVRPKPLQVKNTPHNIDYQKLPYQEVVKLVRKEMPGFVIKFLDKTFNCPTEAEWLKIISKISIHSWKYKAEVSDCDDFAHAFKGLAGLSSGANGVGFVMDRSSSHAYNLILVKNSRGLSVRLVEPQTGKFVKKGTRNYKAQSGYLVF